MKHDHFIGLGGAEYRYFEHRYNAARTNERAVEIPIAARWVAEQQAAGGQWGLEVGNVLRHYDDQASWMVVDAFERGDGVMNLDILDFQPVDRYDWIVSISTVEHIGWEGRGSDEPVDDGKALQAIAHMRSLLTPGGRMLISFPTGFHPRLDEAVESGELDPDQSVFMLRIDGATTRSAGLWAPAPFRPEPYRWAAWSSGGVWFGVFS